MNQPIITLTTDFGTSGPYVAAMKGVILGINPAAGIVDVSHEIGRQNVREAALVLYQVVPYFPAGTIHVVVVDPGVGSDRRLLCVRTQGHIFLAPDNGVLSWIARRTAPSDRIELRESRFWRDTISPTFHGRDILAPVAAHLSLGARVADLGPSVADWVEIPWPKSVRQANQIDGEILAVDRFGNLISNLEQDVILSLQPKGNLRVSCCGQEMPLLRTYSDAPAGQLLALIGSCGLLELAVRNGSAAERLNAYVGSAVVLGVGS